MNLNRARSLLRAVEAKADELGICVASRLTDARFVLSDGGALLQEDGKLVGAIGVSGGAAEQDGECARAAVAVFASRPEA